MQRPKESGWIGRVVSAVRALFAVEPNTSFVQDLPQSDAVTTPSTSDDAVATQARPVHRMLAARLAVQAKLNVPTGKKARVAPILSAKQINRRPVEVAVVKRASKARSVYLPARHMALKAAPKPRTNVVPMPVAKVPRPAGKPMIKPVVARAHRLAA